LARKVWITPQNGGVENSLSADGLDFSALDKIVRERNIGLIVVGPEKPLESGIVDYFRQKDILIFGPNKAASMLETSKLWAKSFMQRYGVKTAPVMYRGKNKDAGLKKVLEKTHGQGVVKYDGLAGGKGVFPCSSVEEARSAILAIRLAWGKDAVYYIEEKLVGAEVSVMGLTDGKTVLLLPPSQDHKQLLDGDLGPNTGGMGAFTPVSWLTPKMLCEIEREIIAPTLSGIAAERLDYRGFIYFGIMMTENGPCLLEYNVRLGDPETQVLMPALKSDLLELLLSSLAGKLAQSQISIGSQHYVNVVLAADGYPGKPSTGMAISGIDSLSPKTLVFHSATCRHNGELVTNGGRVLSIVSAGDTLQEAIDEVYGECAKISFPGKIFRTDIGRRQSLK
jgi:phosphoribosylamine--glycine ligase